MENPGFFNLLFLGFYSDHNGLAAIHILNNKAFILFFQFIRASGFYFKLILIISILFHKEHTAQG